MEKGRLREQMPGVAALIDDLRKTFGEDYINGIIAAGMRGEPMFSAAENGHSVGTPVWTGSRVVKDERGNPYILIDRQGQHHTYIADTVRMPRSKGVEDGNDG
jgi:hypothetical protein